MNSRGNPSKLSKKNDLRFQVKYDSTSSRIFATSTWPEIFLGFAGGKKTILLGVKLQPPPFITAFFLGRFVTGPWFGRSLGAPSWTSFMCWERVFRSEWQGCMIV